MGHAGQQLSIMRWINYHDTNMQKFERAAQYIFNENSSPVEYRHSLNLSVTEPVNGLRVIQERWKPRGDRLFKHGVISFGVRDLAPDKALSATDELLSIYTDYPVIYSVHTNIPRRIHAHFIMAMTNVYTGKKFEQNPAEFYRFRDHYNETMVKHSLPPLKGYVFDVRDDDSQTLAIPDVEEDYGYFPVQNYDVMAQYNGPQINSVRKGCLESNKIIDSFRNDFARFYNFGRGRF